VDEGVPLSALAAELVGIYRHAPTREDEEYAAEAIDDLLDEIGDDDDEVLFALLDLPETELTDPLVDDVVSMLADTGSRVVERLLDLAVTAHEPGASRALDALDRMDDDVKSDGLHEVLAGRGPEDLRRTAADELVRLGHAGASHLQEAFADPWSCDLAQDAVEAAGGARSARSEGPSAPSAAGMSTSGPAGASPDEPAPESPSPAPGGTEASVEGTPPAPERDALEAEFRAFLERFERESGT